MTRPVRLLSALLIALAVTAAACGDSDTEISVADIPTTDEATTTTAPPATTTTTTTTTEPAPSQPMQILIADDFVVTEPPFTFDPSQLDVPPEEPTGHVCANGEPARTVAFLPAAVETATALDGAAEVHYQRFTFDSPEAAEAIVDRYGVGNCEAVLETIDDAPSDEHVVIVDKELPLDITSPHAVQTVHITPEIGGVQEVGLLFFRSGSDVVLIVSAGDSIDTIGETLEAAAGPYA